MPNFVHFSFIFFSLMLRKCDYDMELLVRLLLYCFFFIIYVSFLVINELV